MNEASTHPILLHEGFHRVPFVEEPRREDRFTIEYYLLRIEGKVVSVGEGG